MRSMVPANHANLILKSAIVISVAPDPTVICAAFLPRRPQLARRAFLASETEMSVEFIGMIQSQKQSEIHPATGPAVDPDYVRDFARP
jgi:alkanesulfonate monooxygenase